MMPAVANTQAAAIRKMGDALIPQGKITAVPKLTFIVVGKKQ
jgi:hypothetical protein